MHRRASHQGQTAGPRYAVVLMWIVATPLWLSASTASATACTCDCNDDTEVTVNELITMVNIALGNADPPACAPGIPSGSTVDISLIVRAVNNALDGCVAPPPSPTPTPVPPTNTPETTPVSPTLTYTPTITPTSPPNSCAAKPDGSTCDAGTDSAHTSTCMSGTCGQCTAFAGSPRFVDNGDGTITDRQTCLVWDKKDDAGGLHDKDNTYQWSISGSTAQDGGAFTVFLAGLNTAAFAGHHDWRLPSEDGWNPPGTGPKELESILASPCGVAPCVGAAFNTNCGGNSSGNKGCTVDGVGSMQCSCTQSYVYWSATSNADFPTFAWCVDFNFGAARAGSLP